MAKKRSSEVGKASRKKRDRRSSRAECGAANLFPESTQKLNEARVLLDRLLECRDADSFRALFHAYLTAARAVTNVMQKEGAHTTGFEDWYEPKREEMRNDELMRFVHDARVKDFHKGEASVAPVSTKVAHFSTEAAGPPPEPNASLVIGASGIYWVVGKGTGRERRIAVQGGGSWETAIALLHSPASHKGQSLANRDPLSIARLALSYLEDLLHEAIQHFGAI